jgi:hypothetical protein
MDTESKWLVILLIVIFLSTCAEKVSKDYLRTIQQCQEPERSDARQVRFMGLPPPPDCTHLANVGKPDEWAGCMGAP